ncbi:MAG: aspartyl/glutamyl-tRNA amidotransferase subunit C [Gemmatimonadetes bacterium]|nr:aspartyl/glutamyl-tRNA amidotransferase subunit C [Gemmatimonadota bacterium]
MSVGRNHAVRIAALARLRFGDAELTRITAELNRILDHVETLRTLEQASPPAPPDERASTRYPGAEEPDALRDGIGPFAPDWREGFFVVPPLPGVQAGPPEEGA